MPTTVIETIGTGGDSSTPTLWEGLLPTNLVTADEIREGHQLNQEFSGAANQLTIAGQTVDATRYIVYRAAPGASFADNANKLTNALRYNASNGAALRKTNNYSYAVQVSTQYTRISGLQFAADGSATALAMSAANCRVEQCIARSASYIPFEIGTGTQTIINCLGILDGTASQAAFSFSGSTATIYNCTAVRPSNRTAAFRGFSFSFGTRTINNCASFGFTDFSNTTFTGSNNATDAATIPSGTSNQTSLVYADQFEQPSNSGSAMDFRTKAGAKLIGNGTDLSGSGVTTDIVGTARVVPYDIGVWKYTAPDVTVTVSGIALAASAGTLAISLASSVSGIAATASAGTVESAISTSVSGNAMAVSAGSLGYTIAATVSGDVVVGYAGTLAASLDAGVVGVATTALPGFLFSTVGAVVAGVSSTAFAGIVTGFSPSDQPVPGSRTYFVPEADREYATSRARRIYRAPRDIRIVIVPGRE